MNEIMSHTDAERVLQKVGGLDALQKVCDFTEKRVANKFEHSTYVYRFEFIENVYMYIYISMCTYVYICMYICI